MDWIQILKRVAHTLSRPAPTDPAGTIKVGQGGENERRFSIGGIPHLLHQAGNEVAHFVAVFDRRIERCAHGDKLLPEVVPRWHLVERHEGASLEDVAEEVIRALRTASEGAGRDPSPIAAQRSHAAPSPRGREREVDADAEGRPAHGKATHSSYEVGTLLAWGEMEFPNRKAGGKPTYTSFAVKLETSTGERTLQGEGLKDVLASTGCKIGDRVAVKRLHKEKVPAFDKKTGRPLMDRDTGLQKLWDRWVWQINLVH